MVVSKMRSTIYSENGLVQAQFRTILASDSLISQQQLVVREDRGHSALGTFIQDPGSKWTNRWHLPALQPSASVTRTRAFLSTAAPPARTTSLGSCSQRKHLAGGGQQRQHNSVMIDTVTSVGVVTRRPPDPLCLGPGIGGFWCLLGSYAAEWQHPNKQTPGKTTSHTPHGRH